MSDFDLGIYKNSQSIVNGVLSIPQNSVVNVMFVTLSKQKDDEIAYRNTFLHSQRMLAFILLPLAAGLFVFRDLAVQLAFGPGWEKATTVLAVWSFASVLRVLFVSINTSVYVSRGRPRISLYCQLIDMAILIPTCIFGIRLGFEKFVLLRGIARLDIIIPNFIILSKIFGIKFRYIAKNVAKPIAATALMAAVALLLRQVSASMLWSFAAIALCIVFYFGVMWIIARDDLQSIVATLLKRKRKTDSEENEQA